MKISAIFILIIYVTSIFVLFACSTPKRQTERQIWESPVGNVYLIYPANNARIEGKTITFAWKETENATRYTFELSITPDFKKPPLKEGSTNQTEFSYGDLREDGTEYFWKITAWNSRGEKQWAVRSFQSGYPPFLTYPENKAIVEGKNITFKWESAKNAEKYKLELSKNKNFHSILCCDYKPNVTELLLLGFPEDGTEYYWRIIAWNGRRGWGKPSKGRSFQSGYPLPEKVSLQFPDNNSIVAEGKVKFRWTKAKNAIKYLFQLSESTSFNKNTIFYEKEETITETIVNDNVFKKGCRYYWTVQSKSMNKSSNVVQPQPKSFIYGCPVVKTKVDESDRYAIDEAKLEWLSVYAFSRKYFIQVSTESDFSRNIISKGEISSTQYKFPLQKFKTSQILYWRVRIDGKVCKNAWSTVDCFKKVEKKPHDRPVEGPCSR